MYWRHDNPLAVLALEIAPAALFAASVGFAAETVTAQPLTIGAPAAATGAAFLLAWAGLRRIGTAFPTFALPPFEPDEFPSVECVDDSGPASDDDELLLEDVIAGPVPDSRVIRLFDAETIPTAGELRERIDRHLHSGVRAAPLPDATRELHEALDELRRSLR